MKVSGLELLANPWVGVLAHIAHAPRGRRPIFSIRPVGTDHLATVSMDRLELNCLNSAVRFCIRTATCYEVE
eukprot:5416348-Amphidinium_carterae.1